MTFKVVETFQPLYKRDSKGKIRMWQMEIGTDGKEWAHRARSGLEDGQHVTSGWKTIAGKNISRANETSAEQQARNEITSLYTKQRDKAYFDDVAAIDSFEKFKPMLAHDYAKRGIVFDNGLVYAQPKLDGMRCAGRQDGLWSRGGKSIVAVPHVAKALEEVFEKYPDLIIDGELYNHALRDDFNKIMSLCRKFKPTAEDIAESAEMVQFHVYDLFDPHNPDMLFSQRIQILTDIVTMLDTDVIQLVETIVVKSQEEFDAAYDRWAALGYEGEMGRYNTPYENKRSRNLLKRKEFEDAEFVVLRVEEGKGNWAGYVKRFVVDVDGKEVGCGVRGDQATLLALYESNVTPDWAKVQFFGRTEDGSLRFPVVLDWGTGERSD